MNINPRVVGAVAIIVIGVAILDQTTTFRILGIIQSLVTIALGITAILFLWKRM